MHCTSPRIIKFWNSEQNEIHQNINVHKTTLLSVRETLGKCITRKEILAERWILIWNKIKRTSTYNGIITMLCTHQQARWTDKCSRQHVTSDALFLHIDLFNSSSTAASSSPISGKNRFYAEDFWNQVGGINRTQTISVDYFGKHMELKEFYLVYAVIPHPSGYVTALQHFSCDRPVR